MFETVVGLAECGRDFWGAEWVLLLLVGCEGFDLWAGGWRWMVEVDSCFFAAGPPNSLWRLRFLLIGRYELVVWKEAIVSGCVSDLFYVGRVCM